MQQMAGNMGLLNPFVLNQFSVPNGYGPYSQVENKKANKKTNINTDKHTEKQILATGTETQPSKRTQKKQGKKYRNRQTITK